jgi:hypothetical protein
MIGKFCSEKIYEILASQIAEEVCKKNKEVIGNHNLKKMCWEPGSNYFGVKYVFLECTKCWRGRWQLWWDFTNQNYNMP